MSNMTKKRRKKWEEFKALYHPETKFQLRIKPKGHKGVLVDSYEENLL